MDEILLKRQTDETVYQLYERLLIMINYHNRMMKVMITSMECMSRLLGATPQATPAIVLEAESYITWIAVQVRIFEFIAWQCVALSEKIFLLISIKHRCQDDTILEISQAIYTRKKLESFVLHCREKVKIFFEKIYSLLSTCLDS